MINRQILTRAVKVIIFLFIFIYLFIHLTYVFREPLSTTREHLMGYYSEEKDTVDLVILGTSATFSAIVPMQLWEDYGIPAYDFCTNVQLEDSMQYSLREITKYQSPKLIVIDIAPFMYGHNAENSQGDNQRMRYNVVGNQIWMLL